jgi:TPR repeat protein
MPTTIDDLNVGIENMRFEQRTSGENPYAREQQQQYYAQQQQQLQQQQQQQQMRRYSPNDIALPIGPDGAMQIRGRGDNGQTASVYSMESGGGHGQDGRGSVGSRMGWQQQHGRSGSASSNRTFGGQGGYAGEQGRGGVDGYSEAEHRPSGSASFLPYDDPYGGITPQQQQGQGQQYGGDYGSSAPAAGGSGGYFPPGGPQQGQDGNYYAQSSPAPSMGGYGGFPQQGAYGQQPPPQQAFQSQPPHAGYGYDYRAAAAAQNPYYAAATGQLGLDPSSAASQGGSPYGQLHRGGSSVSSLGLVPPGQGSSNSLARSQSSLNIPGGPMRRKATGASTLSTLSSASGSSSGPPITKASVDEYRQRIKADPDPEAQFNFAKYLIEAAKKINSSSSGDEKGAKKYRDALLAESLKLIKRLATQGTGLGKPAYADAQFFLANCLGNGSLGLQVDHEKAYNLYVQASKQNHSAATYRTAVCNELGAGTRRDHARAVLFYRKASALGDTAGMYKLGMILLHGLLGQQRNPKEALAWLKRAASQADDDNPHALHELGLLYEKPPALISSTTASLGAKAAAQLQQQHLKAGGPPPTIVPFDPIQAREYFTQAAQLGYPPSQFKLGACYEFGTLTCPVDPRRSIAWYTRAAERGDSGAELALSGWYLTGSEGVLKQSDSEAYLWARRAANKGLAKAEYAVGYYSEVGIGVKAELEEAKRWYMRAAGLSSSFFLSFFLADFSSLPFPFLSLLTLRPFSTRRCSSHLSAQGNKRAMQRLTELKKLGADKRGAGAAGGKGGKGGARPTRKDAETECVVM